MNNLCGEKRLVLLFDEFDVVNSSHEIGLGKNAAIRSFIPFLFWLLNENNRILYIFAIGRIADDIRSLSKGVLKTSIAKRVPVLDTMSATELIYKAEKEGTLLFSIDAVEYILKVTNGHPYFLQLLCRCIWAQAYRGRRSFVNRIEAKYWEAAIPRITQAEVEIVLGEALDEGEYAMSWIWEGLRPEEKIFASVLAQERKRGEHVPIKRVLCAIDEMIPEWRNVLVENAGMELVERGVLKRKDDCYSFEVEIFGMWITRSKYPRNVARVLEREHPEADRKYEIARDHYERKEFGEAIRVLNEVLTLNKVNYKAFLLMGDSYLRNGNNRKAVECFRKAYKIHRPLSKPTLIRGLLMYAEEMRMIDERIAIETCAEAGRLDSSDEKTNKLWNELWEDKARKALKEGKVHKAIEFYKQARNREMVEKLDAMMREKQEPHDEE
jgi:tetratricopeptide (TPR) repeat protein